MTNDEAKRDQEALRQYLRRRLVLRCIQKASDELPLGSSVGAVKYLAKKYGKNDRVTDKEVMDVLRMPIREVISCHD